MTEVIRRIIKFIDDAIKRKIWGDIVVSFQDGKPIRIQINESRKL